MNVFDLYIIGEVDSIKWNFNCLHLSDRLRENGVNLDYIKNMVLNEEPIYFEHSRGNRYEVFFETPDTKEYDELKLIFACHNDEIAVISVMQNTLIGTNKNQTKFYSKEMKNIKSLTAKAHAKRARMY